MKYNVTHFSKSKGIEKPTEKIDKKLGLIKWGEKNDYPLYLIDMYNGSAWHQGIIRTKAHYIAGNGFENANQDKFLLNQYSDFSIEEITKRCSLDFEIFDSFCVIGVWNREGNRVAKWEYVNRDDIRTNADESMYYFSKDWTASRQNEKTGYREISPLNENNRTGEFLICYNAPSKKAKGESGIYPVPYYVGGLTAINTDVLISRYHLHEIQNGFKGGTLISMNNGTPETTEEARAIRDQIKGDTTSVEDANEVVIVFSDSKENEPTVLSLNGNDLADRYNLTEKSVQQNILVSHSATNPVAFGIIQEGSFNAAESQELFEIFKKTYVSARQEQLEFVINKMAELSGYVGEALKLKEPNPFGEKTVEPVEPKQFSKICCSKEDEDIKVFSEYGETKDKFKSVTKNSVPNDFEAQQVEEFEKFFFDKIGNIRAGLTGLDKNILTLLKNGEGATSITSALDEPLVEVVKSLQGLTDKGLISDSGISELGNSVLKGLESEVSQFEVRYSYEVKAGLGAEVIPTTRAFCRSLINLDRMYTRDEINVISARLSRDVWRYRGGFYHNPKTDKTSPWCRHEWVQHLVVKN